MWTIWLIVASASAKNKSHLNRVPFNAFIVDATTIYNAWRRKQALGTAVCATWSACFPTKRSKRCSLWECSKKAKKSISLAFIFRIKTYPWNTNSKFAVFAWKSPSNTSFSFQIMPILCSTTPQLKNFSHCTGSLVWNTAKMSLFTHNSNICCRKTTK